MSKKRILRMFALPCLLVVVLAIANTWLFVRNGRYPSLPAVAAHLPASAQLLPSVSEGDVHIQVDSGGAPLSQLSAKISYPADQVQFVEASSALTACSGSLRIQNTPGNLTLTCNLEVKPGQPQVQTPFSLRFQPTKAGTSRLHLVLSGGSFSTQDSFLISP